MHHLKIILKALKIKLTPRSKKITGFRADIKEGEKTWQKEKRLYHCCLAVH
jgi:hypothetical protein